jgi:PEP-CTERM motif
LKSKKKAAISVRWLAAVGIATAITQPSAADVLYTYQTSPLDPLQALNHESDSFTIEFLSPFVLAPNSYYNISVADSASFISSWSASDSVFGISMTGSNAPISLVPAPGLMAGGSLPFCGVKITPCFGGAIATNATGQIDQWNLIAGGFLTFNNPFIGTVDAITDISDQVDDSSENRPGGPTGSWNGFTPSPFPGRSVPEPSTWAMMLLGFAGLGWLARLRRRKLTPV